MSEEKLQSAKDAGIKIIGNPVMIELVAECLAKRLQKSKIKAVVREVVKEAGCTVDHTTIEKLIQQARKKLREELGASRQDHRSDAYALYCAIIADEDTTPAEKMKAQERIDQLLGLEAKFASDDGPSESARAAREAMKAMQAATTNEDNEYASMDNDEAA